MKILKWILISLAALLALVFVVLFTSLGNSLVKPYAEKIASEKSGMNITLETFKLRLFSLDVRANINECLTASANGSYSLFGLKFDLDLAAKSNDLTKFGVNLKQESSVAGKAVGRASDFDVKLDGVFASSPLKLDAKVVGYNPKTLNFNATKLDLKTLLALANQPLYATGSVGVDANLVDFKGDVNVKTANVVADVGLIKKQFGAELPVNFKVALVSKTALDLNAMTTVTNANVTTPLATLKATNAAFDLNTTTLNAGYTLNVPNLAKLEKLISYKLNGAFTGTGIVKFDKTLYATLNSNLFKSTLKAVLNNDKITANMAKFRIEELLYMANLKKVYTGEADLVANYNLTSKSGGADVNVRAGQLAASDVTNAIKMLLKRDVTTEIYKNGTFNVAVKQNDVSVKTDLKSNKSTIKIANGKLDLGTKKLNIPIAFTFEKTDVNATLGGSLDKMTYNIKSNYLADKAKEKATKEVNRFIEKKLNGKGGEAVNKLLDGLFK